MAIEEKGPWKVEKTEEGKYYLASDDFTHDVILKIYGDFYDAKQQRKYAEEIARRLNTFCSSEIIKDN